MRKPKSKGLNRNHLKQIKQKEHERTVHQKDNLMTFLYVAAAVAGFFIGLLLF